MPKWSRMILLGLAVSLTTFSIASCVSQRIPYEFEGEWDLPPNNAQHWSFTESGGSFSSNLFPLYTVNFDYVDVNEGAEQIQVNVTSVTGVTANLAPVSVGTAYITYSLSGDDLYVDINQSSYPGSGGLPGPYTRG